MGRKITEREKVILLSQPDVRSLSDEHIVLIDGTVIDPQDYDRSRVVAYESRYVVLKRTWQRGEVDEHGTNSTHVLARIIRTYSPFGTRRTPRWTMPVDFAKGTWEIEEEMGEEKALAMGAFKNTPVIETIPDLRGLVILGWEQIS